MIAFTRLPSGRPRVDHRARLVDAAADAADDAVDDLPQVLVVAELHVRQLDAARALDVDAVGAVDEDVADRLVLQQRLERAEAERLVHHVVHQPLLVVAVEQALLALAQLADDDADLVADGVRRQRHQVLHVQPLDELLVDADLHLLEVRRPLRVLRRRLRRGAGGRRRRRRRGHQQRRR
jgi:hypothetical protein